MVNFEMNRWMSSVAVACLLVSCSETTEDPAAISETTEEPTVIATSVVQPAQPIRRVVENFEVGEGVYVRSLAVDEERNSIWVGTSVGVHEIDLVDRSVKNTFTRDHGLANEYVFSVGVDHEGYKWFGTNAGGVSRYKEGDWKTFFPMHGLADYWVYCFASQQDGTLWIGTWAGANSVDPNTGKFTTYVNQLINEWVYGIAVDSQDRVWFGTEGGISLYDGKGWRSWTHADGLGATNGQELPPSTNTGLGTRSRHDLGMMRGGEATYNPNYVFSVHMTDEDVLWAGTWGGGVSRFDGKTWKSFTREDGLAGDIVYSIIQDSEGVFWFGTNSGISRYDGKTWNNYGVHDGLISRNVYTMAEAPDGDIWAGTRGGVVRLAR